MAQLTADGYQRKRLSEYKSEIDAAYKTIFGDNIDLSPDSPDGQIIGIFAEMLANLDQSLEDIYNAFDPQSSQDLSFSKLVAINGLARKEASFSTADVTLTGIAGVVVPLGSIIKTSDTDIEFALDADVTLTGGSDAGTVTAVESGSISALAGTLTQITTPIAGWSTVTNATNADLGQDEETDEELRIRRALSTAISSKSLIDSTFSTLSALDDVTGVAVLENDTASNIASPVAILAHGIHAIVNGGDDDEIAKAIFSTRSDGSQMTGSETVVVVDDQGQNVDIKFSRPDEIDIDIEVDVTENDDFPSNGDQLIKDALVAYGEANYNVGVDVVLSRLYTPVNSVPGGSVSSLKISINPAAVGSSDISIELDEIALITDANITVNVT